MAVANIIESDALGPDVQAMIVPSAQTHAVTFTVNANNVDAGNGPFGEATRMVTIGVTAAAYLKFGKAGVTATADDFDSWQPANTLVSYVIQRGKVDRVSVWDGST